MSMTSWANRFDPKMFTKNVPKVIGGLGASIGTGYGLYKSFRDDETIGGGAKNVLLGNLAGTAVGLGVGAAAVGAYKFSQTANRMGGAGKAASMYSRFGKMKANKAFNAIKSAMKG